MMSSGHVPVLVVLPGDRTDLLLGKVVRHLAQVLLLVCEREINHVSSSPRDWRGRAHHRLRARRCVRLENRLTGQSISAAKGSGGSAPRARRVRRQCVAMQSALSRLRGPRHGDRALRRRSSDATHLAGGEHLRRDRAGRPARRRERRRAGGAPGGRRRGSRGRAPTGRARARDPPDARRAQSERRRPAAEPPLDARRGDRQTARLIGPQGFARRSRERPPVTAGTIRASSRRFASSLLRATSDARARVSSRSTWRLR